MVTRFILVRHGQTEWNLVERYRGRADIALNNIGREQARRRTDCGGVRRAAPAHAGDRRADCSSEGTAGAAADGVD